jgi:putative hydrolase of the HAD superfamily
MDIKVNANTVIVFDLDDTLYNELDYLQSAYQSIAQQIENKDWKSLYASMFSMYRNNENVFEKLTLQYGVGMHTLLKMYRNHQPKIKLFEGVLEVIHSINSKSGKTGIITDGRLRTQMSKIKALGLLDLIDKVVISEEIGTEKPNPNNFKVIEIAYPNHEYWYIADNLSKDFIAPKKMGWRTVGLIDNGKNIHDKSHKFMTTKHKPEAFILAIKDLNIT